MLSSELFFCYKYLCNFLVWKNLPPKLAHECPRGSGGGMGQQWPAAGLGAQSVAVCAWDISKEDIMFIISTIVWLQVK